MLGKGIRTQRLLRGLTQAQLAHMAGLSTSLISQFETGKKSPSIDSLRRIANSLGVPMFRFLAEADSLEMVVRADQRKTLSFPKSALIYQSLMPEVESPLEMLLFSLEPEGTSGDKPFSHPADECLFVMSGTLEVEVEGEKYTLGTGDSIYIPNGHRHMVRNIGTDKVVAIFAISPPMF